MSRLPRGPGTGLLGLVVAVAIGCGAPSTGDARPDAEEPLATVDDPTEPERTAPPAADRTDEDPPSGAGADGGSGPTDDVDPDPAQDGAAPSGPDPGSPVTPSGEPVPGPIAALFAVPGQVRVDEAGTTSISDTVEVVQLTGAFLGGDLRGAVRAFDAALEAAGLPANRDASAVGAAYVIPIDERTLAIGLVAEGGTISVAVDLLIDRDA